MFLRPIDLPNKPSELIRLAVKDLKAFMRVPGNKVDMNLWYHTDFNGNCSACFAGAVMRGEGAVVDGVRNIGADDVTNDEGNKWHYYFLNEVRSIGDDVVDDCDNDMSDINYKDDWVIHAIMGDVGDMNAFARRIDPSCEGIAWRRVVTPFDIDPAQFFIDVEDIAREYELIGC